MAHGLDSELLLGEHGQRAVGLLGRSYRRTGAWGPDPASAVVRVPMDLGLGIVVPGDHEDASQL